MMTQKSLKGPSIKVRLSHEYKDTYIQYFSYIFGVSTEECYLYYQHVNNLHLMVHVSLNLYLEDIRILYRTQKQQAVIRRT